MNVYIVQLPIEVLGSWHAAFDIVGPLTPRLHINGFSLPFLCANKERLLSNSTKGDTYRNRVFTVGVEDMRLLLSTLFIEIDKGQEQNIKMIVYVHIFL